MFNFIPPWEIQLLYLIEAIYTHFENYLSYLLKTYLEFSSVLQASPAEWLGTINTPYCRVFFFTLGAKCNRLNIIGPDRDSIRGPLTPKANTLPRRYKS